MVYYPIKSIEKFKFAEDDLYVLVSWEDSIFSVEPTLSHPGCIIPRQLFDGSMEWIVKWENSWIELSELNSSHEEWQTFYSQVLLPTLESMFNTHGTIIID